MKALGEGGVKLYSPKTSTLVEVSGQHPTHSTLENYMFCRSQLFSVKILRQWHLLDVLCNTTWKI